VPANVYVDESKRRGYLVVAAAVSIGELAGTRASMRTLLLPCQPRLHFRDERGTRKQKILDTVLGLDIRVDLYSTDVAGGTVAARGRCLTALTTDLLADDTRELVIERDDGMVAHDKRAISGVLRSHRGTPAPEYRWERAHDEPLLWIPDALAWCWTARGSWRASIQSFVTLREV